MLRIGEAAKLRVREAAGWQRVHTGRLHHTLQQQQQRHCDEMLQQGVAKLRLLKQPYKIGCNGSGQSSAQHHSHASGKRQHSNAK
jgi:hypothetical protein